MHRASGLLVALLVIALFFWFLLSVGRGIGKLLERRGRDVERTLRRGRNYAVLPLVPLLSWNLDVSGLVCGLVLLVFVLFVVGWALGRGWRAGTRRR